MKCISVQNIAAASAVLRMLLRIVVVKPDGEALDPHLWPGAVGSDRKSDIQAVEMSFRRRVTGLNLIDRVRRARSSAGAQSRAVSSLRPLSWFGHLVMMPPGRLP